VPDLLVIYARDERNINFGISKGLWGMPARPDGAGPKGDGSQVSPGDVVMLLTGLRGQVRAGRQDDPTFDIHDWAALGGEPRIANVCLAIADSYCYEDRTPVWPDEVAKKRTYPFRFSLTGGTIVGPVPLRSPMFSDTVLRAIRSAAVTPLPVLVPGDQVGESTVLAEVMEASSPEWAAAALDELDGAHALTDGTPRQKKDRMQAFGRDQARNTAVERQAVTVATKLLEGEGWSVTDKGIEKIGYDLHCERTVDSSAQELHVEVKGSSQAIDEVIITANEMNYALAHPERAWLVVVEAIQVRPDKSGVPIAEGGSVAFSDRWKALPAEARAIKLRYRFR
jgi:hypothetical protein